MRIVLTTADLDSLPEKSIVLDTYGITRTKELWGSWKATGRTPIPARLMADGRPMLVLWDPTHPEILLDVLIDAATVLDLDPATVVPSELPGAALLEQEWARVWAHKDDAHLTALAQVDFLTCWSKGSTRRF